MIDIDALKKLAESASPGPWARETVQTSCGVCHKIGNWNRNGKYASACIYDDYSSSDNPECAHLEANASFIAAANPQAILELIAQLEQYKKDAERYRWLRAKAVERREYEVNEVNAKQDFPVLVMQVIGVFDDDKSKFDNDIDTAMQKETK